jgi:hypothetical protein
MRTWWRHSRFVLAAVIVLAFAFSSTAYAGRPPKAAAPSGTLISEKFVSAEQLAESGQLTVTDVGASAGTTLPMWWCSFGCYYITNVSRGGDTYSFATQVSGWGPSTISLSFTSTVSTTWSATGGISSGAVSAGLGFSVTQSQSVTYSNSVNVPWGYCWRIVAYNQFANYGYDVMFNPFIGDAYKAGYGTARRFLGVYYGIYWC